MKAFSSENKNQEVQLNLGLKSPLKNTLYRIKNIFARAFVYLEVLKFLKDPLNWFFLVLAFSLIFTQFYFIYKTQPSLPGQLPVLSYFADLERRLVPTLFIYLLPMLSTLAAFVCIKISYQYFHRERVMSMLLMLSMLLTISMITYFTLQLVIPFYG